MVKQTYLDTYDRTLRICRILLGVKSLQRQRVICRCCFYSLEMEDDVKRKTAETLSLHTPLEAIIAIIHFILAGGLTVAQLRYLVTIHPLN